jgi:hypothetical protein
LSHTLIRAICHQIRTTTPQAVCYCSHARVYRAARGVGQGYVGRVCVLMDRDLTMSYRLVQLGMRWGYVPYALPS